MAWGWGVRRFRNNIFICFPTNRILVNRKDPNVNTFAQPKKHDTRNATKRHEATRKDTKTTRHVTKRHETARNHMKTTRNDAQHETSWKDTKNVTERRKNVTKRHQTTQNDTKRRNVAKSHETSRNVANDAKRHETSRKDTKTRETSRNRPGRSCTARSSSRDRPLSPPPKTARRERCPRCPSPPENAIATLKKHKQRRAQERSMRQARGEAWP